MRSRILACLLAVGCGTEAAAPDDCLENDIDCAPPPTEDDEGGKDDAWGYLGGPRAVFTIEYRLASLPASGRFTEPYWKRRYPDALGHAGVAWTDSPWPLLEGQDNARWMGPDVPSPLEKYDRALNGAAGCATRPSALFGPGVASGWADYRRCAGPAARHRSEETLVLNDGRDNDGDGVVDNPSDRSVNSTLMEENGRYGWAAASLFYPEPQHAVVKNGVRFEISDVKAMLGDLLVGSGRTEIYADCHGGPADCEGVNAGALHLSVANYLGGSRRPLVAVTADGDRPVLGYTVTSFTPVEPHRANACLGLTGDAYRANPQATGLHEVRMSLELLTPASADTRPQGVAGHVETKSFHYIVETRADGKVIGGRYCADNADRLYMFWSYSGDVALPGAENPGLETESVLDLLFRSVVPEDGPPPGAQLFTQTPRAPIPGGTGVSADVVASGVLGPGPRTLAVRVDITHPDRSYLQVLLRKDFIVRKVLVANDDSRAPNLLRTFRLDADEVGAPDGRWSVQVIDDALPGRGTLNEVTIWFE